MWSEQSKDGVVLEKIKALVQEGDKKNSDSLTEGGNQPNSNVKELTAKPFEDIKEEDEDNATSSKGRSSPGQNSSPVISYPNK